MFEDVLYMNWIKMSEKGDLKNNKALIGATRWWKCYNDLPGLSAQSCW